MKWIKIKIEVHGLRVRELKISNQMGLKFKNKNRLQSLNKKDLGQILRFTNIVSFLIKKNKKNKNH